jgi:regulator of protease activity HflC (stomatin/prohibitin superfamily)
MVLLTPGIAAIAQGQRESAILYVQGDKESAILRAQEEWESIKRVLSAIGGNEENSR